MLLKNAASAYAARNTRSADKEDRVPQYWWVNVGFYAEDGTFVQIPGLGRTFDKAEPRKGPKDLDTPFAREVAAGNDALAQLKQLAEASQPGDVIDLTPVVPGQMGIQFRHAENREEPSREENPLSIDLLSLVRTRSAG